MKLSYDKLWKMLIDRKMKKGILCEQAGISRATMAKLAKGENVMTDVLVRICYALDCDIADIAEVDPKTNKR